MRLVGDDGIDTQLFRHIGGAHRDGLNTEIGETENERRMQDRLVDQQRDDVAGSEPLRTRMMRDVVDELLEASVADQRQRMARRAHGGDRRLRLAMKQDRLDDVHGSHTTSIAKPPVPIML